MKFSERETYQFVKAYFRQENLWNTKHLAYKSNERRLVAYQAVVSDFMQATGIQLSVSEVRVKIKNLKSTYSQELDKIRRRSSGDYVYTPTIKWFAVWDKYVQSMKNDKYIQSKKNDTMDESNTTDDEIPKTWLSSVEDNGNDNSIDPFESSQANDYAMLIKSEPKLKQDNESTPFKRRRRNLDRSSSTETADVSKSHFINPTDLIKDDEFDIYGKYIASQLRSMELQRALTLQMEIQNLVSGARLADLTGRSSHSNIS